MITTIVTATMGQHHIRLYDADDLRETRKTFVKDRIENWCPISARGPIEE